MSKTLVPEQLSQPSPLPTYRALEVDEVAEYLNCHPATVRREVRRGRLRAQKCGQRWRFRAIDVEAYLSGVGR